VLRLNFRPSLYLAVILVIAHAVSAAVLWLVDISLLLRVAGTILMALSLSFYLHRVVLLRAPSSIVAAQLRADGNVEIERRDGSLLQARLLAGSFVHPYLTTILFLPAKARFARAIVVLPDSLPEAQLRELRVWLKWRTPRTEG
jgi:toxin CptA